MEFRRFERRSFAECYLTVVGRQDRTPARSALEIFTELGERLSALGVEPIQEKVHASADQRQRVLEARQSALRASGLDPGRPCSYVDGKTGEGQGPVSVQIWGIVPAAGSGVSVATVELPAGRRARLMSGSGLRLLWAPGISGTDEAGGLAESATGQAERMFANAEAALQEHGFAYVDVARTWIHLRRILDWYAEFNRVRTAFYAERGITGEPDGRPFPASTGIQGRISDEECVMDVLAAQSEDGRWEMEPLTRSSRQERPFEYGSAFSRGMSLGDEGAHTILVSGTASIGADGQTMHAGDREAQVVQTLLTIAALIEPQGGSLRDIAAGVLYYADEQARRAYEDVIGLSSVPILPLVPVLADLCRPELLVEIEAVAVVPRATPTAGSKEGRA